MIEAMLAVPMGNQNLDRLLDNDAWGAQEKSDGHRVVIRCEPGQKVRVYNRAGQPRQHVIPAFMIEAFTKVPFAATFDGELVGTNGDAFLWLFDLPVAGTQVTPDNEYQFRHEVLTTFMAAWKPNRIDVLPLAVGSDAKRALLAWVEAEAREGVVFKRLNSRYMHGRRSPNWVKHKLRQDGDVVVLDKGVGGRDNLVLGAYDGDKLVEVGHCTALNGDGPSISKGDVIVVNYVHFSKGGRLVQPTRPRSRLLNDKRPEDCTIDQFRRAHGK